MTKVDITKTISNRGQEIITALGVVSDDTASANFRLRNEHTKDLKEGVCIALRNGKSNVIDEHILLDLDKFGKVTLEDVKFDTLVKDNNISDETWERRSKK